MSAGRCLLKNGILWDTKKMVDILIDDERIVQIVPGQSLGAVDARIIDLTGKTILPGFFNAHVHLYGVRGPLPDELLHRFVSVSYTHLDVYKRQGKEHLRYIVACAGHKAAQHRAKQAALCRESYDRGTQDRTWDDTDPTVT